MHFWECLFDTAQVLLGVAFLILWLTEVFVFSQCHAKVENDMPASTCRKNPMICSSVNPLFFMPVILHARYSSW
jgi:hypothetical protein